MKQKILRRIKKFMKRIFTVKTLEFFHYHATSCVLDGSVRTTEALMLESEEDLNFKIDTNDRFLPIIRLEINRGARVFVFTDDGEITHFSCIAVGSVWIGEINRYVKIQKDELYIYNCYTRESSRGEGLFTDMIRYILKSTSADRFIICSLKQNFSSISAIKKAGFFRAGAICYKSVLFNQKWIISGDPGVVL